MEKHICRLLIFLLHALFVLCQTQGDYIIISKNFKEYSIGQTGRHEGFIILGQHRVKIVPGLIGTGTVSFQPADDCKGYFRHRGYVLHVDEDDGTELFKKDSSFFIRESKFFPGFVSFESYNFANYFIRHQGYRLKIANENSNLFKNDASFHLVPGVVKKVILISKDKQGKSIKKNSDDKAVLSDTKYTLIMSPALNGVAGSVSFRTSDNYFLYHTGINNKVEFKQYDISSNFNNAKASFKRKENFYFPGFFTYESSDNSGYFLRRDNNYDIYLSQPGTTLTNAFKNQASFFNIEACSEKSEKQRITGACNNLNNPVYGATNQDFRRICIEGDAIHCESKNVLEKPGAQTVCDELFILNGTDQDDGSYTALLTYFGQFLDHDMTLTVHPEHDCLSGLSNENTITDEEVCNVTACYSQANDQCPMTKENAANAITKCYKFTKSQEGGRLNAITSFLDLSSVYGSDEARSRRLRSFINGKLRVQKSSTCNGDDLLPFDEEDTQHPDRYLAGDVRANENPILLALHTIFVLEHNRICDKLLEAYAVKCPGKALSDDKMFHLARQITVAQMQNIVINEYLPELGFQNFKLFSNIQYDSSKNPGIFQEFSTAAYRFGHTAVKNKFTFGDNEDKIDLRDLFFNTQKFNEYGLKGVLQNQWKISSEKIDNIFSKSVGEKLFIPTSSNKFQSLCGLNIQRGRDHRLGSYKCVLQHCLQKVPSDHAKLGGKTPNQINTINDLVDIQIITNATKDTLASVYGDNADLDDIDLFAIGLNEEKWAAEHRMGFTFHCILEEQFGNLIKGDRFFFSNCAATDTNCINRRDDIKERKFSDILCSNIKGLESIPQKVFQKFTASRQNRSCEVVKSTREVNVDLWLNDETCSDICH